jgi:hypothetical protein
MDEAFVPLSAIVEQMMAFGGEFVDEEAGVRTYIAACEIESPVEFDITRDSEGRLRIGTTPPIYGLRTTVSPSYHRLRFVAKIMEETDG